MQFFETDQFAVFVYSLFLGVLLGILYDFFKIKRMLFPAGNLFLLIDDLIYTVLVSVILILFVFKANSGNIRWYMLLCPLSSLLLYRVTISKPVIFFCGMVISAVKKVFRLLFHLLSIPLLWLCTKLSNISIQLLCNIMILYCSIKKLFSYRLYWCKMNREASKGFRLLGGRNKKIWR